MSEAGQTAPESGAEGGAEQGQGIDAGAVMDRLEQLSSDVGTLREAVQPQQEPEYGQDPGYGYEQDPYAGQDPLQGYGQPQQNPYGYGYGAPQQQPQGYQPPMSPQQVQQQYGLDPANVYDDYGNVNPQAAAQYQQMLQQAVVNPAIQQAVMPLMEQVENMRLDAASEALVQKYPEYGQKDKAEELVQATMEWAQRAGLDPRQATRNDAILEQQILIARAREQATQGGAAAGNAGGYELEGGQGAGPGGSQPASFKDEVDRLREMESGGASPDALSFWGVT